MRRTAWAIILGATAVALWILVSPAGEMAAAGRLSELVDHSSSDAVLYRMWALQLPGTALACGLFSLFVLWAGRKAWPGWRRGGTVGTALGGTITLLLFASPPPGVPFVVWSATFYLTGFPVVFVAEVLPERIVHLSPASFGGLVAVWPMVVTGVLVAVGTLSGGLAGEWLGTRRGVPQNNQMQRTGRG